MKLQWPIAIPIALALLATTADSRIQQFGLGTSSPRVIVLDSFDIGGTTPLSSTIATTGVRVSVHRVTVAVWNTMTATDFGEYAAVIIPDTQRLFGQAACSPSTFDVFRGQGAGWMAAIDGNVVVTATNEFLSTNFNGRGGSKVAKHFAAHTLARPNTTGLYVSLSSCYSAAGTTNVAFLEEAFGESFTVTGVPSTGVTVGPIGQTNNVCDGTPLNPQIVASGAGLNLPVLPLNQNALTNADFVSLWSACAATAVFTTFGANRLEVFALEQGVGPHTSALGAQGHPFVLATANAFSSSPTTASPTSRPTTSTPTRAPTVTPTPGPTTPPTRNPTHSPTLAPSNAPSEFPTGAPSARPTLFPSATPTAGPSNAPTAVPSSHPTLRPTTGPTFAPSLQPTTSPTEFPTAAPTAAPTGQPSANPTAGPTALPTHVPTATPTAGPTESPTAQPTRNPTVSPTSAPSHQPTSRPSHQPTTTPTALPTTSTTQTTTTTATTVTTSNSCFQGCMATCPVTHAPVTLTSEPTFAPSTLAPTPFTSTLRCAEIQMNVNVNSVISCPSGSIIEEIVYVGLGNPIGFCVNEEVRSEFVDGVCSAPASFGAYNGCLGQTTCLILTGVASVVLPLHSGGFTASSVQRGCLYGTHTRLKMTFRCRTVSPAPTSVPTAQCDEGWGLPATFRSASPASSPRVPYQYYYSGWANSTIYLLTRTQSPTAAPTALDCSLTVCSQDCVGPCGWSSRHQQCILGGRTTAREASARFRTGGGTCAITGGPATTVPIASDAVNRSAIAAALLDRRAWSDAEATCTLMGGHLASVHSLEEYEYIVGLEGLNQGAGPTATSSGHCTTANGTALDSWVDREGFSCVDYEFEGWCDAYGGESSAWNRSAWGSIEGFGVGGVSALDACVACGCNRRISAWIGASRFRVDDRNSYPFTYTYSDSTGSTTGVEFSYVLNEVQAAPCVPISVFGRPSSTCRTIWAGSGRGGAISVSEPQDLPCTPANFSDGRPCGGTESCVAVGGHFEEAAGRWEDADCNKQKLYVCKREWPAFCHPTTTTTTSATSTTRTGTTTTTASTTTATTFDCFTHCQRQCVGWQGYTNCSQIQCSLCCDDEVLFGCGWQSFTDTCVAGAVSRLDETDRRGECSQVRTNADCFPPTPPPPAAVLLTAATCHLMNQCGRCCNSSNGACGWSRRDGVCKAGAVTKPGELTMGPGCHMPCPDFSFFTAGPTAAPTSFAPTLAPASPPQEQGINTCGGITCSRCCRGDCGWSSAQGACIFGGVTRTDEESAGSCAVTNCVDLPLTDAFRVRTGLTSAPSTSPTGSSPTTAPTPFVLGADQCHFGNSCGRCCTGPTCGWSKKNGGFCKAGGRTTSSELGAGRDCSSVCSTPP